MRPVVAPDDSIPNAPYIDMCENLPVNDPAEITVPTIIMRGQYDGIAAFADIVEFFSLLPNADKEFAVMPDIAHGSFTQMNYMRPYHVLLSLFTRTLTRQREQEPPARHCGGRGRHRRGAEKKETPPRISPRGPTSRAPSPLPVHPSQAALSLTHRICSR